MLVQPRRSIGILSIIHSSTFGGTHNQAQQLHEVFSLGDDYRLTVLLPDEPGDGPARLRAAGLTVLEIPLIRPRASLKQQSLWGLLIGYPRQTRRLYHLIKNHEIDVVEVHGLLNIDGALAARLAGRGVVWQLVDTRPPMALRWMMMPFVQLLADVIMTTGTAVAAAYPGARLRPSRLRTFIPPARIVAEDEPQTARTRARVRAMTAVPDEATLVVSVGNLNPQKGYEDLLAAVAACRAAGFEVELRIRGAVPAGYESYASSLRDRARTLGFASETVGVLEAGLGVADLMAAADIFALASRARSEGLSTVVLEAMACGLPAVVTDVGAIGEVIENGICGLLVAPDAPELFAGALMSLLSAPDDQKRMGAAARHVVREKASPAVFAAVHAAAYDLALRRHPSRRRSAGAPG